MNAHRLLGIHFLFLGCVAVCTAQTAPSSTAITTEDLVRLSQEEVGEELSISLIQSADQVPRLSPQEVIGLRQKGVSANVLTAVIQRGLAVSSGMREKPASEKHRRIRLTASLHPQDRAWWRVGGGAAIEQTAVTWSLTASSWGNQENIRFPVEPKCLQQPLCTKWDYESETCIDAIAPDSETWRDQLGCYLSDQARMFDQEYEIFDAALPEPAGSGEIRIYYRGVDYAREGWFTRSTAEAPGKREQGYVNLQLWGSDDFDLKMHIQLFISRKGFVQDFKITECEVANRDQESLERRLMSQEQQYCRIVASPL